MASEVGFGSFFLPESPLVLVGPDACLSLLRLFRPDLFLSLRRPWLRSAGGTCTVGLGGSILMSDPGPPIFGNEGSEGGGP